MRRSGRLLKRIPLGTKYVVESDGPRVRRYIEFPDGRRIPLPPRKALTCGCTALVPEHDAVVDARMFPRIFA